jgi:TolB-like protein
LSEGYGLPHPLDYYTDICITAFDLISTGSDQKFYTDLLMNEYITFLERAIVETIRFNK